MCGADTVQIARLAVGPLQANCYLFAAPVSRETAIIDPGGDGDRIVALIEREGMVPRCIINTHAHPDHTAANAALKERYGIPLWIHEADAPMLSQAGLLRALTGFFFDDSPPPDRLLRDGDPLTIGAVELMVLHTPGHTPGSICLLYAGTGEVAPVLFTGDTLFADSVGRTDLPGGSYDTLMESLKTKISPLPDPTRLFPGHGPETTVGRERRYNPFFSG